MCNICLDCLQKQKPWVNNDMAILYSQPSQCSECGQTKKLVYVYTETDKKVITKDILGAIRYNDKWSIHYTSEPYHTEAKLEFDEVEITLQTLVVNLGWDTVRDKYMYIEGQEDGKPLAFKTHEEYNPYLDYRVIQIYNKIILRRPNE